MQQQKVTVTHQKTRETKKGKMYILKCQYQNFNYTLWVNQKGQIIKEKSPMGIKIVKVNSSKATKNLKKIQRISLREKFSIPVKINYPNLKQLTSIDLKLKNIKVQSLNLESNNQSVKKIGENFVILKLRKNEVPERKKSDKEKNLKKFLKSTSYIQKNNSKIIKMAQKITNNSPTLTSKINSILSWINNNIRQVPTLSLPSALKVLENKIGDCNEITYLFTAFSRAIDIPTKTVTGLIYLNNKFQYHMWSEIYINNQWVSVDPTFTQFPSDITHIKLLEGGYENQIKLANLISKIDIKILKLRGR